MTGHVRRVLLQCPQCKGANFNVFMDDMNAVCHSTRARELTIRCTAEDCTFSACAGCMREDVLVHLDRTNVKVAS